MWPTFRQSLLNTIQTIQDYHETHTRLARNVSFITILLISIAATALFVVAMVFYANIDLSAPGTSTLIARFTQGISAGQDISILSAGLIAIHLYKGSRPADGLTFTSGIPAIAWRLYSIGICIILSLYLIYHVLLHQIDINEQVESQQTYLLTWALRILDFAVNLFTACMAVYIYLRGIGKIYDLSLRPAFIAATVLLYFWVRTIVTFIYMIHELITTPLTSLFSSREYSFLLFSGVSVWVYMFGIFPAAAIIVSVAAPETDIQFDGETETQL